jgi:hypothetical protein
MKKLKFNLLLLSIIFLLIGCGSSNKTEEVELPTMGLITVVKEVEADKFLIDDEITVPDTSQSLIIANYMNGSSDTFTLAEARLMHEVSGGMPNGLFGAASMGLMGYMMGRSMGAFSPSAGAYTSQDKFNKVNNSAGNSLRSSSARVTRPVGGSGFGSGKSTRSVGG